MLYRIYRAAKRVPGVGRFVNGLLRVTRNLFWSWRPAPSVAGAVLPDDYIAFVEAGISGADFTLIEVGAGDGRVLCDLAARHPGARFIGVDIQKAAVTEGNRHIAERGIANVTLFCASCLEDTIPWDCDYLISRTALIYLNRQEMEKFLRKRLAQVRRALLLQEIVSLTGKTEVSHFFAQPLADMVEQAGSRVFTVSTRLLAYPPWKRENLWSGAEVVIRRAIAP